MSEDLAEFESGYPNLARFAKATTGFAMPIRNNRSIIPHHGECRHSDEPISTAFVESTVNAVVDKRFSKKLDGPRRGAFTACCPAMAANTA